jgi:hypothetical protein
MAAPTFQAEGATVAVTTGAPSVVIPTHQTDDILVVSAIIWAPNTGAGGMTGGIPTPSGWTPLLDFTDDTDYGLSAFWKRATSASETVTLTRPAGWDTGPDTCYGARAYVVRGCIATGDPWDAKAFAGPYSAANQTVAALTVSGTERMALHFGMSTDNAAFAMTSTGWTIGTEDDDATGTDCAFQTNRKDNISASTTADAATVAAPAQGFYGFAGVSFKPPTAAVNANAGVAAATGTSNQPAASVAPSGGLASVTATALNATVQTGRDAAAGVATAASTALGPTATVSFTSGVAAATGAANAAAPGVSPNAGSAAVTGTALNATTTVSTSGGVAAAVGTANQPAASVAPTAGVASATAAALDATVSTAVFTNANAGLASATGAANQASTTVSTNAAAAAAIATAVNPSLGVSPTGGIAAAVGTAYNATVTTGVPATDANAGAAAAIAAAYDATVTTTGVVEGPPRHGPPLGAAVVVGPAPRRRPHVRVHAGVAAAAARSHGATTEWNDDETALLLLLEAF